MVYFSPRMDHVHLIGLNTLSKQTGGGYLPCAPAEWSLFYIQQGTATVSISAQSVHVHKGDFLLLPPLSCHEIEINGDSFVTLILFSGVSAPHPEFFCHLIAEDTAIAQPILSLLVDRNNLTYRAQDHILEALLIQLFSLSAFLWNEPPMSSLPIDILKYLNTHYQEDLVLND